MLQRSVTWGAAITLVLPALASAEALRYDLDPAHTEVGFAVRHFVSKVPGRFDTFTGTIWVDPKDPSTLKAEATIDVASIDTNNEKRDTHLRSPDFFDAANHPKITFVSKTVAKNGDQWTMTGDLTMRGVTKEVALDVEVLGFMADPWGGERAGFEARGRVDRQDFGIRWNQLLDQGGAVLGDDVEIVLHIEAVMKQPEQAKKGAD